MTPKKRRHPPYDEQIGDRIVGYLKVGAPRATAARAAGLSPLALESWLAQGRQNRKPYSDFLRRVEDARAQHEAELLALHRAHQVGTAPAGSQVQLTPTSLRAIEWALEHIYPKTYATPQRVVVEQQLEQALDRLEQNLDRETFQRVVHLLAGDAPDDVPQPDDEPGRPREEAPPRAGNAPDVH